MAEQITSSCYTIGDNVENNFNVRKGNHREKMVVSTTHVLIPNDGPIFHLLSLTQNQQKKINSNHVGVKESMALLRRMDGNLRSRMKDEKNENESITNRNDSSSYDGQSQCSLKKIKYEETSMHLLKVIIPSNSEIRMQLKALQAYRSSLLHIKNLPDKETTVNARTSNDIDVQGEEVDGEEVLRGMYRLLLELALSCDTPTSMRRAIGSCLKSLKECMFPSGEENDELLLTGPSTVEKIHQSVIESIFQSKSNSSSHLTNENVSGNSVQVWKDPLQSFFEVCNFPILKPTLFALNDEKIRNDMNDRSKTKGYMLKALKLFLHEGSSIVSILDQYENKMEQGKGTGSMPVMSNQEILKCMKKGSQISATFKLLFPSLEYELKSLSQNSFATRNSEKELIIEALSRIETQILHPIVSSHMTNGDVLSATGAALSQVLVLQWIYKNHFDPRTAFPEQDLEEDNNMVTVVCSKVDQIISSLPPLNALALIRGLTATLPQDILILSSSSFVTASEISRKDTTEAASNKAVLLLNPLGLYLLQQAKNATDATIRLSSLRGLETVLSRLYRILTTTSDANNSSHFEYESILKEILSIVFLAWESIVSRSITSSAADLFASLMKILQYTKALKKTVEIDNEVDDAKCFKLMDLKYLVKMVLAQPSNRKGKYVALDIMLPLVGAKSLIQMSSHSNSLSSLSSSGNLVTDLINEIGGDVRGRNKNSGAIRDLLGKLLSQLRVEMTSSLKTGNEEINFKHENKRDRRRKERLAKKMLNNESNATGSCIENKVEMASKLPAQFTELWVPPLASILLFSSTNRRNQTAAFCFPLLSLIAGSRTEAPHAYCALLMELDKQWRGTLDHDKNDYCNRERVMENNIWSKLELAKHASAQNIFKDSHSLKRELSRLIPIELLKSALMHSNSSIRLVGFSAINAIISSHFSSSNALVIVEHEVKLWMQTLPYACKCFEKEYTFKILQSITDLLQRIVTAEDNYMSKERMQNVQKPESLLLSFARDFLIMDLFCKQGSFPGTALEKEQFILALMRCIVTFVSGNYSNFVPIQSLSGHKSKGSGFKGERGKKQIPVRRISQFHQSVFDLILGALLSKETCSSLLSLTHSMWDRTRTTAYIQLRDLFHIGFHLRQSKIYDIPFPLFFSSSTHRSSLFARAVHLASSPRQRESDTGARIVALLYSSSPPSERGRFLSDLLHLLVKRLDTMQKSLGVALAANETGSTTSLSNEYKANDLPLAHGLLQALRLSVECAKSDAFPVHLDPVSSIGPIVEITDLKLLYEKIVATCCRSIRVSLAVVADLKQHDDDLDSDETLRGVPSEGLSQNVSTPLNVNTGAIGANAVYASVKAMNDDEEILRNSIQRVIIGSWLLTKEACAALASTIETSPVPISYSSISSSGTLLLQTLTSLKHQGAAFAAHKALEQICVVCVQSTSRESDPSPNTLPSKWSKDLLHEISMKEKVRDSTLRRSTGIALGFLSMMRSEPPTSIAPRTICPFVLSNLLRLSLPSKSLLDSQYKNFGAMKSEDMFVFPRYLSESSNAYVKDSEYRIRTRVHALNILRLSILDAPLATEMRKFVGDGIMSALLGYNDETWAVRNSATMVFAAAMLRVIDADKNATSSDLKQDQPNGKSVLGSANAITARELFRSYPHLSPFLVTALKDCMLSSSAYSAHPSLYPILLLLSRLQPASASEDDEFTHELVFPFINPVFECLGHNQHKIRVMSSRALAKLCTGEGGLISSREALLAKCELILNGERNQELNWNKHHGAMLAIQMLLRGANDLSLFIGNGSSLTLLLFKHSTWDKYSSFPPSCSTVALETIYNAKRFSKPIDGIDFSHIKQIAWNLLETIESLHESKHVIGLAALARLAAEVCCHFAFDSIFDLTNRDGMARLDQIQQILRLLQSECFDVRFAAIKAFKKPFRQTIDRIVGQSFVDLDFRSNIILSTGQMLSKALWSEWKRSECNDSSINTYQLDMLGSHSPSLRRLSRCLIDCLAAYKELNNGHVKYPYGYSVSFDQNWNMLIDLRRIGGAKDDIACKDPGESISGNSLELMAFAISSIACDSIIELDQYLSAKIDTFAVAVMNSTDPLSLWVVRYSAAVAIRISGILSWRENNVKSNDPDKINLVESLQKNRFQLYMQALNLLQDNDADVRVAAGQALRNAWSDTDFTTKSSPVPLLALEEAYLQLSNQFSQEAICERLMNRLLIRCKSLQNNIVSVLGEFSNSEESINSATKSVNDILNLSAKRKIFENEDPNPFEEDLVISQLAVSTIILVKERSNLDEKIMQECFSQGKYLLSLMKHRKANDIAHELSWSSSIFSELFTIFAACVCAVYIGGGGSNNDNDEYHIVADARTIVQQYEEEERNNHAMHPCIWDLLVTLSKAQPNDSKTQKNLLKCCFLLPGNTSSGV